MRKSALLLASTALAVLVVSGVAWADTFAVRNTNDSGAGSLRAAITEANEGPARDVITFAPDVRGEIRLKSKLPQLRSDLEMRGPEASRLTVRRAVAGNLRIFYVAKGSTAKISGLKISNGLANDPAASCNPPDNGGGVFNEGTLTLKRVIVSSNSAGCRGGGVYNADDSNLTVEDSTFSTNSNSGIDNDGGTLTVRRTTFSANRGFTFSAQGGGGILNSGTAKVTESTFSGNIAYVGGGISSIERSSSSREVPHLTVTESTFSANRVRGIGGGIASDGELEVTGSTFSNNDANRAGGLSNRWGTMTVAETTFSANTANERGGGIYVGSGNPATIRDSTFSANTSGKEGGGLYIDGTDVIIINSTFARNGASRGGGVDNGLFGDLSIENSTFANNEATIAGGGIYNYLPGEGAPWPSARIFLEATIVAGNEAPEGPDVSGAPFTSRGYNLIGDISGASGLGGPTNITNTSPKLDPDGLKDNGGSTKTFALTQSSPALDAVEEGCPPPATDQRGVVRPQDGDGEGDALCDIGAYERAASSPSQ